MKVDMKMDMKKKAYNLCCFVLIVASLLPAQESLNYEVPVDAMLIPLFVVDNAGNPVYDLEQHELKLLVNGRPVEISYFKSFRFEYNKGISEEVADTEKKETAFTPPERMIFIIIDGVYNSAAGLRRSKKIASGLITKSAEGDRFVIIQNTPGGGLKHIAGPGERREHLIEQLGRIVPQKSVWGNGLSSTTPMADARSGSGFGTITGSGGKLKMMEYKRALQRLGDVLSRFKYVLKTVTGPKIVFLISEGISKHAFEEPLDIKGGPGNSIYTRTFIKTHLFNYLKEIVKAVNEGGSVLYTVNPQTVKQSVDQGASGEMSLRYLAGESGGKYFSGSDTEKIVKRIKKTTTAYYEMAFQIPPQLGSKLELTVQCKRKGIFIHTLSHSERSKPYRKMEPVQKKVFAHNVVTGGGWSRMLGKVTNADVETLKKEKDRYIFTAGLPEEMRNRLLDVWMIYMNTRTGNVEMDAESHEAGEALTLSVKRIKGMKQFVVIIEPSDTICLHYQLN